jgi:CBS domain-containing protein
MDSRCPDCGTRLPRGVPAWVSRLTVADVMTRDPVTLGPEDNLQRGAEFMRMHRIRRVPIVLGETLVGLLTEGDLKRAEPSTLSESQEDFQRVMEETQIARIMVRELVTVKEDATLLEAARTLHNTKYGALPVLREGRLVGILTDNDMLRALAELLEHAG